MINTIVSIYRKLTGWLATEQRMERMWVQAPTWEQQERDGLTWDGLAKRYGMTQGWDGRTGCPELWLDMYPNGHVGKHGMACLTHKTSELTVNLKISIFCLHILNYGSCRARHCGFLALDGHCILGTSWSNWRDRLTILQGQVDYFTQGRVGQGTRCPTPIKPSL